MKKVIIFFLLIGTQLIHASPSGDDQKAFTLETIRTCSTQNFPCDQELKIALKANPPAKISPEAPAALHIISPLDFEKRNFSQKDAQKTSASEIEWIIKTPSSEKLEAELVFFLCTISWCKKFTERFQV